MPLSYIAGWDVLLSMKKEREMKWKMMECQKLR